MFTILSITKQKGIYLDNISINNKNVMIDFYLNYSDQDTGPENSYYTYQDNEENTVAIIDPSLELKIENAEKGVFSTTDYLGNRATLQFYKTGPLDLSDKRK